MVKGGDIMSYPMIRLGRSHKKKHKGHRTVKHLHTVRVVHCVKK